jgi:hypothetical protein
VTTPARRTGLLAALGRSPNSMQGGLVLRKALGLRLT